MKVEKVNIVNSKDQKLSAIINHAEEQTNSLAILCPGYLDSKEYLGLSDLASRLCSLKYDVVRFDPTGVWDSEGEIHEYDTTQYLKDVKSVLEYMLSRRNYEYVLLGGHSRGAKVSILYAARDNRITEIVSIMPSPHSITDELWKQQGFKVSTRDVPNSKEIRTFKVPYSHIEDLAKYDAIAEVKKIKVPILLVAGELDDINPPSDVKQIYDAANEPKRFVVVPGVDHDYRHAQEAVDRVNDLIISNLNFL